jgi:hypothetical protein
MRGIVRAATVVTRLLYLDQNSRSGIAEGEPAFRELKPSCEPTVAAGAPARRLRHM